MLARLRASRPGWSTRAIVTTVPEACPVEGFFGDVESVPSFAAAESHRRAYSVTLLLRAFMAV